MDGFDLRRLPFMRWDIDLKRDESSHGYFARLVALNGDDRVSDFAASADMNLFGLIPEQGLGKLRRLPLSEELHARLEHVTPIRVGTLYRLCGTTVRSYDISMRSPRWCPACIAEEPYRRIWFDLPSIRRCPYHGDLILDRDEDGNPLPWEMVDFSIDREGRPIGRSGPERNLRHGSFGHYLLGRLGLDDRLPAILLDKRSLSEVIPACAAIGLLDQNADHPDFDIHEAGFTRLRGSQVDLAEYLRTVVRRYPDARANTPIKELFGNAYNGLGAKVGRNMRSFILRAMEEAVSAELAFDGKVIQIRDLKSARITTQEVEDRHGIDAATVATIARYLGLHRGKKRKPLIEDDVPAILDFVENLVDRQTAANHLNISEHAMQALIDAGYVSRFFKLRIGEFVGQRFHVPELDALLAKLDELPLTGDVTHGQPFFVVAKGHQGLQHGDLALQVLRGEAKIAGRKPNVHGFKALVIETGKRSKRPRVTADPNWLSIAHVQALLNFRKETIWEMNKLGLLRSHGDYVKQLAFRREDVESIQRTYARSMDFCGGLGITKYRLRDLMVEAGVTPLIRSDARSYVDTIYEKAAVMEALGLQSDPTVGSDPNLVKFWTALKAVARGRFPALLFSEFPMAGGQTVGTTTRLSVLPVTYDLGSRTIRTVVAPAERGPVFSFDMDAADWGQGLHALFAALLAREGEYLKKRSDYNKGRRREAREQGGRT